MISVTKSFKSLNIASSQNICSLASLFVSRLHLLAYILHIDDEPLAIMFDHFLDFVRMFACSIFVVQKNPYIRASQRGVDSLPQYRQGHSYVELAPLQQS